MGLIDGLRISPTDEELLKTHEVLIYNAIADHHAHMRSDEYFPASCSFCFGELRDALGDAAMHIRRGR